MKSFEQLAQEAFEAHVAEVERHGAVKGHFKKPTWQDLQPEFKAGWLAAAKQLWHSFTTIH